MLESIKDLEAWQILLGLVGTGMVSGVFLGKLYQKIMDPPLGELRGQLKTTETERDQLRDNLVACATSRDEAQARVANFETIREALFGEEDELWRLHPASPPDNYFERLANSKPKIITVANLKGGVGKTTITANLAAYFEKRWQKRVLAIDLDYQGSLSETLLRAAGLDFAGSLADGFISGEKSGADLLQVAKSLNPALPNTQLITSNYDLARVENRMMLRWLLRESNSDVRFHLADVLLHPAVQERFDVILIDGPPRLSTAAVNALVASHHLIVPTVPDSMSVPSVIRFLVAVGKFLPPLNPALNIAGVAINLAYGGTLTAKEQESISVLRDDFALEGINSHVFEQHIPRLAALANIAGQDVLYLKNRLFREGIMEDFGAEVARSVGFGVLT